MDTSPMNIKIAIRLFFGEGKCFGPGPAELLRNIDECGSLRAAAGKMNISYSKAWTMLRNCEKALDFALLERETGGAKGGYSHLTQQGRHLLEQYKTLENKLNNYGEELVKAMF